MWKHTRAATVTRIPDPRHRIRSAGRDRLSRRRPFGAVDRRRVPLQDEVLPTGPHVPDTGDVLAAGAVSIQRASAGPFAGSSFCFTGTLKTMSRADAEEIVRENAGVAKNSVTRDLTYLVTNTPDSGSGKAKKARDLGVSILSELEFLSMTSLQK